MSLEDIKKRYENLSFCNNIILSNGEKIRMEDMRKLIAVAAAAKEHYEENCEGHSCDRDLERALAALDRPE